MAQNSKTHFCKKNSLKKLSFNYLLLHYLWHVIKKWLRSLASWYFNKSKWLVQMGQNFDWDESCIIKNSVFTSICSFLFSTCTSIILYVHKIAEHANIFLLCQVIKHQKQIRIIWDSVVPGHKFMQEFPTNELTLSTLSQSVKGQIEHSHIFNKNGSSKIVSHKHN